MREFKESDLNLIKDECAVLTKQGIRLPNGEVVKNDKIVNLCRETIRVLKDGGLKAFDGFLLMEDPNHKMCTMATPRLEVLSEAEQELFFSTVIDKHGNTIDDYLDMLDDSYAEDTGK